MENYSCFTIARKLFLPSPENSPYRWIEKSPYHEWKILLTVSGKFSLPYAENSPYREPEKSPYRGWKILLTELWQNHLTAHSTSKRRWYEANSFIWYHCGF